MDRFSCEGTCGNPTKTYISQLVFLYCNLLAVSRSGVVPERTTRCVYHRDKGKIPAVKVPRYSRDMYKKKPIIIVNGERPDKKNVLPTLAIIDK
ncbi:MAG: hypothetical protein ACFFCS_07590 [Candidatus Hodarchaeota archaeon]